VFAASGFSVEDSWQLFAFCFPSRDRAGRYDPFATLNGSTGDGRFVASAGGFRRAERILAGGGDPIASLTGSIVPSSG
jgi:hypothetical protein